MQIIEVTDFGVRSAVIRLKHRDTPLQFVLYPMIHMAEAPFYAAVARRLRTADVVVAEGIGHGGAGGGGELLLNALTLSYRVLRFNRRHRLVEQDIDYDALGVEIVRPDVGTEEFRAGWHKVPLWQRLLLWCALPVVMLARLFGGTRTIWSQSMAQDDLPSPQDEEAADAMPELDEAFSGERDARLLAALAQLHEDRSGEPIEVAVVYGAAHLPPIVYGLLRLGYRPRSSDWLTVVAFG